MKRKKLQTIPTREHSKRNPIFLWVVCLLMVCTNVELLANDNQEYAEQTTNPTLAIRGVVVDTNDPPTAQYGVTVVVKGTTTGTTTDAQGFFSIKAKRNDILVFSFVGYKAKEFRVTKSEANLSIAMEEDLTNIEQIVVTGMTGQQRKHIAAAVGTVAATNFESKPITRLSQALQGGTTGLLVSQSSGLPGGDGAKIKIRGVASLLGSDPLVLVDGFEFDMDRLDPSTVESISILKDAAAASMYGAKAGNGVILITTKRGTAGKVSVSYNGYYGIQQPMYLPDFVDAATYMDYMNIADENSGGTGMYTPEQIKITREGTDPIHCPNTDWMSETMKNTSPIQEHSFALSGGNTTARFALSAQYMHQDGMYKYQSNGFDRFTVRANTSINLSKKLIMFVDMFVGRDTQNQPVTMSKSILDYIYLAPPTLVSKYPRKEGQLPDYDYYGTYFEWMNPLANLERGTVKQSVRDYVTINARPTWHITDNLQLKGQIGYRISTGMDRQDRNAYVFLDYDSGNEAGSFGAVKSAEYTTRKSYWMVGANLDYVKTFNNHRINLLAGWSQEVDRRNGWDDVALLSFFGKAYYSYKDKYLAEVGIRRDGSSLFGPGQKWGNFPSAAIGWNINKESFMEPAKFIDNMKLRLSYGLLGNNNVSLYRYQTIIDNSGSELINGNPSLTWETVKILDAGLDLSLFGQKLEFTFDWFRKVTEDLIVDVPSTPSSGLLASPMNVGRAEVKGFEIGLGFNHSFSKDIDFSINVGYSYNKSKWLEITNDQLISGNTIYKKGRAIKEYYGYESMRLLTQDDLDFRVPIIGGYNGMTTAQYPGDIRYRDQNDSGDITDDDKVALGDQDPNEVYYANLSFRYKNFDFDAQINGVGYVPVFYQGLISNPLDKEFGGTPQKWHMDYWSSKNPDPNAKLPRPTTTPGNNGMFSTFWKANGAFVRVKYIQIGYNFKGLNKKIHTENLRLYVNVQNPFTFTKMDLIDPETKGTHTTYPMFKTYSVGLNIKF